MPRHSRPLSSSGLVSSTLPTANLATTTMIGEREGAAPACHNVARLSGAAAGPARQPRCTPRLV
uniref:Uncharacterized protein n=1 Tax=Arundo donax TaxID=35708 RepID=A0A0A8Y890_ARUDO